MDEYQLAIILELLATTDPTAAEYYTYKKDIDKILPYLTLSMANVGNAPNMKDLIGTTLSVRELVRQEPMKILYKLDEEDAFKDVVTSIIGTQHLQVACDLVGIQPTSVKLVLPEKKIVPVMFATTLDYTMMYYKTVADRFLGNHNGFSSEVTEFIYLRNIGNHQY